MEHLAKLLDADIACYSDGKDRSGALGYVGACFASMKKKVTIGSRKRWEMNKMKAEQLSGTVYIEESDLGVEEPSGRRPLFS